MKIALMFSDNLIFTFVYLFLIFSIYNIQI